MIRMGVGRQATIGIIDRRPEEDLMESAPLLDRAGRRRSPATLSSFHQGRLPRNKGLRYLNARDSMPSRGLSIRQERTSPSWRPLWL
jgi:hypothetical protein